MRIYECELKLKHAKQRNNQLIFNFVQYLNRLYKNLNYTVIDVKKLRILRRKTFQPIVYNSFKHVNVKTATIYASLTSLYIVIKNILRDIDQMKKTDSQKEDGAASYNIDFNNDQASNANHNQSDEKPQKNKKPSIPANRSQQSSQKQQQKNQFKPKRKSKKKQTEN